ncbi:adhesin [Xenorhabdus vietnamensis]|uniref:Adhesin n=1 Tax=Xenorhabdus vietnamensis TaxID=351656 RepID=A0A1Y2SDW3_9GAMM|nr:YadA-like family protein [Xenorhabdus vietnamensis]OTA16949.1 adhesin [Xenorhabdus vietnamensis]
MRNVLFKSMALLMLASMVSVSYASNNTDSESVSEYPFLNLLEYLRVYQSDIKEHGFKYIVSDDSSIDNSSLDIGNNYSGIVNSIAILESSIGKRGHHSVALSQGYIGDNSWDSVALSDGRIGDNNPNSVALSDGIIGNSSSNSFAFIGKIDDKSGDSVAIGHKSNVKAKQGIAIGRKAIAHKIYGIALGQSAISSHTNAVAIGVEAETDRDNSVSFGNSTDITKNKQLTNIADGIKDQDAVTLAQLNRRGFFSNPTYTTSYFVGSPNSEVDESNVVSFGDNQTQLRLVNIADAQNPNDAVNKKQLDAVKSSVINELQKDIGDKARGAVKEIDDALVKLSTIQQVVTKSEQAAAGSAKQADTAKQATEDSATQANTAQQAAVQSAQAAADSAAQANTAQQAAVRSAQAATDSATQANTAQQAAVQSAQAATDSATKADTAQQAAVVSETVVIGSVKEIENHVNTAKNAADRAEKNATETEVNKRINLATQQESKKSVKETKELNEKIITVKKASEERANKLDAKADDIYEYAQGVNTKMGEYHVYSEKRFNALKSEMRQNVRQLDNKINRVEKRANAGIASVAAMTNIPFSNANRFSVGVGLGQYHDGSAIAVGAQTKLTENINIKASTSWNNSDGAVFGAGFAIGW